MTSIEHFFDDNLGAGGVMVILRGLGPARTVQQCRRAWSLGVPLVEVPVQDERDLVALADAVAVARQEGRLVGAGTLISPELVQEVADAGAAFTVAPGLDEDVARSSLQRGLPHLPGVATGTEVLRAVRLGLMWQKAFPATVLGSGWIAAMRAPFPDVCFVVTGGIDVANASTFLRAGAAAVALGSSFVDAPDELVRKLVAGHLSQSGDDKGAG